MGTRSKSTSSHSAPKPKREPERTCIACRNSFAQSWLVRLVLAPNELTPRIDFLGKLPGRGVYVCPTPKCLDASVKRGALKRGFQCSVSATTADLIEDIMQAFSRHIRSLIAIAGRAGKMSVGNSQVENALRRYEEGILLMAGDASDGVKRKFRLWAERIERSVFEVLSKEELGSAVGGSNISLVMITDAGLAQKIDKEVRRVALLSAERRRAA